MSEIEQSLELRNEPKTRTTIFGKIRTYADLSKWECAFLLISTFSLLATIALTIVTMSSVNNSVDWTLALLLLVHTLLCVLYVFDGVFRERPYEIVIYVLSVFVVLCYLLFNFFGNLSVSVTNPVKIARLACAAVFVPPNVGLGVYVAVTYSRTGNLIFRTVGAQSMLQSACRKLFLFEAVLKFDCHLSILLLLLVEFDALTTLETVLLGVGIPFVLAWLVCGFLATVYENRCAMCAFWATCYLQPAYVGYQLYLAALNLMQDAQATAIPYSTTMSTIPFDNTTIMVLTNTTTPYPLTTTTIAPTLPLSLVTFTLAALSIGFRVALIITSVLVFRNFGIGLKERIVNTDLLNIVSIDYLRHHDSAEFDNDQKAGLRSRPSADQFDSSAFSRKKKLRLFDSHIADYRTFDSVHLT